MTPRHILRFFIPKSLLNTPQTQPVANHHSAAAGEDGCRSQFCKPKTAGKQVVIIIQLLKQRSVCLNRFPTTPSNNDNMTM